MQLSTLNSSGIDSITNGLGVSTSTISSSVTSSGFHNFGFGAPATSYSPSTTVNGLNANTHLINTSIYPSLSGSTYSNSTFDSVYQHQLGFTPLVSVCAPLGMSIPKVMKTKIINGEYVDFALLLEKNDPCIKQHEELEQGMALAVSQGGQIVWKRNKPKQVITSIHSWTTAFLIFSSIFVEAHPTRAQELLRYAHLIRTIHARFGGWGWRSYDQQFRMRQESHPQNSWSIIDGELWSVYVTSSNVSSSNRFQQQNKGYRSGFRQQFKSRSNTSTQFGF